MVGQAVINIRWVGEDPHVNEEFVGLYSVLRTDAGTITTVTTECVLLVEPIGLPLHKFRRLCYNKAGNMSGYKTGVAGLSTPARNSGSLSTLSRPRDEYGSGRHTEAMRPLKLKFTQYPAIHTNYSF